MTRWRRAWEPEGWPGWRIEESGRLIERAVLVRPAPAPEAVPVDRATWVELTLRRARHVESDGCLVDRWQAGAYQRTYQPGRDEPDDGSRFASALRVLDGLPPPRAGRPRGSVITGSAVFGAVVAYHRQQAEATKERRPAGADYPPPSIPDISDALHCDERTLRRAVGRSWDAILDVAVQVARERH